MSLEDMWAVTEMSAEDMERMSSNLFNVLAQVLKATRSRWSRGQDAPTASRLGGGPIRSTARRLRRRFRGASCR